MRMTNTKQIQRESSLIYKVKEMLPDFVHACASDVDVVILHQDAFAADYQDDEYMLLGMAIKYAGLCGKVVQVVGSNRQTLGEEDKIQ